MNIIINIIDFMVPDYIPGSRGNVFPCFFLCI